MDTDRIWDSLGEDFQWGIQGLREKTFSSKFMITRLPSGKVLLKDFRGRYLAPKAVGSNPTKYPIQPDRETPEPCTEFKVYSRGNKVAFKAHNGLFLARVFKGGHVLEAAKPFIDASCFFRPLIGELMLPAFDILNVIVGDLSGLKCHPSVVKKETYINQSEVPESHTFTMIWEASFLDTTVWNRRWGLGLAVAGEFKVLDTTATVRYNRDNKVVSMPNMVFETYTQVVEIPPQTKVVAKLLVNKQNLAAVPFTAIIQKLKASGEVLTFQEAGVWRGLVYHGLSLEVKMEPLDGDSCTPM